MFSGPPADPATPTGPGLPAAAAVPALAGDVPCAGEMARREQVVLGLVVVVSAILTVVPDPHRISLRP